MLFYSMCSLPEDIRRYIYNTYFTNIVLKELTDKVNMVVYVINYFGYYYIEFEKSFILSSSLFSFYGDYKYVLYNPDTKLCVIPPYDYYRLSFKEILMIKHR